MSESNKAGFRWMVFLTMICVAVVVAGRSGTVKSAIVDPVYLLKDSTSQSAIIKGCVKIKKRGSRSGATEGVNTRTLYATQAVTANSATARGSYFFGWKGTEWCESKIGDTVKVRIHKTDPSLNRISTFTGLWYPPFQILLAFFWVIIASRIKPLAWAVLGFNLIAIPLMFIMA